MLNEKSNMGIGLRVANDYARIGHDIMADARVSKFTTLPPDKMMRAYSNPKTGEVWAAEPFDDQSLMIMAHEAGHIATTMPLREKGATGLMQELVATQWGFTQMRKHGAPVTEAMQQEARCAMLTHQGEDVMGMLFGPEPEVVAFANGRTEL